MTFIYAIIIRNVDTHDIRSETGCKSMTPFPEQVVGIIAYFKIRDIGH